MGKRRLPSPEEYGRRLAESKRRVEKTRHEKDQRLFTAVKEVLNDLNVKHTQVMGAIGEMLASRDSDQEEVTRAEVMGALQALAVSTAAFQERVLHILSQPPGVPSIELPVDLTEKVEQMDGSVGRLLDMFSELASVMRDQDTPQATIPVQPGLTDQPLTLRVIGRDANGDISDVRVEPVKH